MKENMSKGQNLKQRGKEKLSEDATEERKEDSPTNAVLSFLQDSTLYQTLIHFIEVIIVGSKNAVLVYIFLYLLIILQTYVTNIFSFPNGSEENIVFSYVCIFTDILDIVFCVTIIHLFFDTPVENLNIDHLFCVIIVNVIILVISMFKFTAVWVLVNYIHTIGYYRSDIHTKVVHWLEIFLLVLFLLRMAVQALLLMNLVVLVRKARSNQKMNKKVKHRFMRHSPKHGKGTV